MLDIPNEYPTVGPVHCSPEPVSKQKPSVPSRSVPAYCPDEKLACRKYIDLSRGVLNETSASNTVAINDRSVPGVAERYRTPIVPEYDPRV